MRDLTSNHRLWLALAVLGLGISTVGTWNPPSRRNARTIATAPQATQIPHRSFEKYVGKYTSFSNEPVVVTNLKIKGRPIQINSRITEGEDWLNGLTFKIRNISKKNVLLLYIELLFPETKLNGGNVIAFDIRYGADTNVHDAPAGERMVLPGDQAEFTITDDLYQKIKQAVETRTSIENINSVQINILKVIFDDDTAWSTGSFMHRDPNNAKRWVDN